MKKFLDITQNDNIINKLVDNFNTKKNIYTLKKNKLDEYKKNKKIYEKSMDDLNNFLKLFQAASQITQEKLEYKISNIVTTALTAVFPEPYEFKVKFIPRRGKTECDLVLLKNGKEYGDILFSSGGGPADVVSFALRCAFWCLNKTRPTLIFDEPFKFVNDDPSKETRELQRKCVDMLKMISNNLNLQMIIITTLPEFLKVADRIYSVELNKNDISEIKLLKG